MADKTELARKAAKIVDDARRRDPDAVAGFEEIRKHAAAIGFPAVRETFTILLERGFPPGSERAGMMQKLSALFPVTEVGSIEVEFFNKPLGRPDKAHLVLQRCPREHDLGAQLNKLRDRFDPARVDAMWPNVQKHLSVLVFIGRDVYKRTAEQASDFVAQLCRVCGLSADLLAALQVDTKNTTLFLDPEWPERVGIFVHLESELLDTPPVTRADRT